MKRSFLETVNQQLRFQRNCLLSLCFILGVIGFSLTLFLFQKSERVVVVPPMVEKEFWIDAKNVSPAYLEQYGYFLAQLLLGKSAYSAPSQRDILLRHASPAFAGHLRKKLIEEEELLKQQNASYTFYPISVHANPKTRDVHIEGERVFYVSGKQVSSGREEYILSFLFSGGRLFLTGVTSKEKAGA